MTYKEITKKITNAIHNIYEQSDIKSCFITGSLAAGTARTDSDVDIFICYTDSIAYPIEKKESFVKFYFDLHKELNREPDYISPAEILSFSQLSIAIDRIQHIHPTETLRNQADFDALCWVGMLISKRIILFPDTDDIIELIEMSQSIAHKWVSYLEPKVHVTINTGCYTDLDKILRRKVSCPGYYDAH